jgi:hypothetical protein
MATTDISDIIDRYFAVWNESDPSKRRNLIAETWTSDASYVDPVQEGEGHDGIDALAAAFHETLPGHRFRLAGAIDSHHDRVRFAWDVIGPDGNDAGFAGSDVAVFTRDGRLRLVTGFLDRVPEGFGS